MRLRQRIQRYAKLLERARSEYDEASRALAEERQRLEALERQADELQQYATTLEHEEGGRSAMHIVQRRQYLSQVFRAIEQLRQQQQAQAQVLARVQQRWREARARLRAMERLLEGGRRQLDRAQQRIEQRHLDEQAAWRIRSRR